MFTERGQLYGTPGLRQTEEHVLVISSDKVKKYSYMNKSSFELKGILFLPPT